MSEEMWSRQMSGQNVQEHSRCRAEFSKKKKKKDVTRPKAQKTEEISE